jgi:molecular chaperone GrpE
MTESNNPVENNPTPPSSEADEAIAEQANALDDLQLEGSAAEQSPEAVAESESGEQAPVAFDSLELEEELEDGNDSTAPEGPSREALRLELQALKGQLEERNGQYLRITADFENFRKRTSKEQAEQEERVKCATILELLPVIDNFERARTQLNPSGEEAVNIHKSYQGIYKQLVECLKRVGVVPMRAKGQTFDPMLHEAVMREPSSEFEDGAVIEELQRGYLLGDRVLRHAMVKVAVASDPSEAAAEDSAENPSQEGDGES